MTTAIIEQLADPFLEPPGKCFYSITLATPTGTQTADFLIQSGQSRIGAPDRLTTLNPPTGPNFDSLRINPFLLFSLWKSLIHGALRLRRGCLMLPFEINEIEIFKNEFNFQE